MPHSIRHLLRWSGLSLLLVGMPALAQRIDYGYPPISTNAANGVFNVKLYGAKGDGTTDDHAAFQAAHDALGASGGEIIVPPGHYCIKAVVNLSKSSVTLQGASRDASELDACGTDTQILNVTGARSIIQSLQVSGSEVLTTTNDTITFGSTCVNCTLRDVWGIYGRHVLTVNATNISVQNSKLYDAFGSAVVYFANGGAGYLFGNNQIDQSWNASCTPSAGSLTAPSAWAGTHVYAACAVVSNSGFLIQTTAGGTSGSGSAPTNLPYGQTFSDGGVTDWQLLAPTTYSGVQADTGAVDVFLSDTDITGPWAGAAGGGLVMTNTGAGTAPQTVYAGPNVTIGQGLAQNIYLTSGSDFKLHDSQIYSCTQSNCIGINLHTGWTAEFSVNNSTIRSNPFGINIGAGIRAFVENSILGNASQSCINVPAGVTDFIINGNNLGTSVWGACTFPVVVGSGASDFYNISNNNVHSATNPISDGGTGTHKTIVGNN